MLSPQKTNNLSLQNNNVLTIYLNQILNMAQHYNYSTLQTLFNTNRDY